MTDKRPLKMYSINLVGKLPGGVISYRHYVAEIYFKIWKFGEELEIRETVKRLRNEKKCDRSSDRNFFFAL